MLSSPENRVAALLTCHNRAEQTLACLDALQHQQSGHLLDVVVVDAGSSDGTANRIRQRFPDVFVIRRGADLYWNAGMRVAFAHAFGQRYDAYLWVNDDTLLDPDALLRLWAAQQAASARSGGPAIVVGCIRDPETKVLTYGGVHRPERWRPMVFKLVEPAEEIVECETMNGNCVLVPHAVAAHVGNLALHFTHGMGDFDYGLRARHKGFSVWMAPGTVGSCSRNSPGVPSRRVRDELRRLLDPKGLPPSEWLRFTYRWAGPFWPIYFLSPYVKRLITAAARRYG